MRSVESTDRDERLERVRRERLLFQRYHARRDPADRDALVERFLPLAHALAARFRRSREPFDDLYQVACLGLVKAIDRFDLGRGTAFSSYAVPTILGELKRYFRDRTWPVCVPRDLKELAIQVDHATEELTTLRGRPPTIGDLAHRLHAGQEEILEARDALMAYEPISLQVPRDREDVDDGTLGDTLGHDEHGYWRTEQDALLEHMLRFLTRRQREVVRLRFGEDLTQREIGARVGLSQMQVSRILREALERLSEIGRRYAATDKVAV
ncbi:MAG TPA: SigB/SigF/SigG family RNA polymerase sigma factor [Solirubrobacteraceae bacterium]